MTLVAVFNLGKYNIKGNIIKYQYAIKKNKKANEVKNKTNKNVWKLKIGKNKKTKKN